MKSAKFVTASISNRAPLHAEESKLLKRQARKPKKPYVIESRMPNSTIPAFTRWRFSGRYGKAAQRDQALHDLRKTADTSGLFVFEYRVPERGQ